MLNTYIYHQVSTTCFGVCYTIFRENIGLLAKKIYAFCNVATKFTTYSVFVLIYNALTVFETICISSFCTLKNTAHCTFNPLNPELNLICYLLALLGAHHFLHVIRIRVKLLTFRLLMSYIYMEHPFLMFLDHTQRRSTVGRTPLDE